jgi:hypothetical protein
MAFSPHPHLKENGFGYSYHKAVAVYVHNTSHHTFTTHARPDAEAPTHEPPHSRTQEDQ